MVANDFLQGKGKEIPKTWRSGLVPISKGEKDVQSCENYGSAFENVEITEKRKCF